MPNAYCGLFAAIYACGKQFCFSAYVPFHQVISNHALSVFINSAKSRHMTPFSALSIKNKCFPQFQVRLVGFGGFFLNVTRYIQLASELHGKFLAFQACFYLKC